MRWTILALTTLGAGGSGAVTIDFEDGTSGAIIDNFYAAVGVSFVDARFNDLGTTVPGMSGTILITHSRSGNEPKPDQPLIGIFTGARPAQVSVTAVDVGANGARLDAYDALQGGSVLDWDEFVGTGNGTNQFATLIVDAEGIGRFELYQPLSVEQDGVEWDTLLFQIPGDFNDDAAVNAVDIDMLRQAIQSGSSDSIYDLDGDGTLTAADFEHLIRVTLETEFGDATLDENVDAQDLAVVRTDFGKTGGWAEGNFDLNDAIAAEDLASARNHFGFAAATTAPEASSLLLVALISMVPGGLLKKPRGYSAAR